MGSDKASIRDASGKTFLEVAHARLAGVVDDVRVSVASNTVMNASSRSDDVRDAYRCIHDNDQHDAIGPIAGVSASLQEAQGDGFDGILITPVDTPNLTVSDLLKLVECFDGKLENGQQQIVCATTSASSETIRYEPLIGIYPIASQTSIAACIRSGEFGLQRFLRQQNTVSVLLPADRCRNINSPQDLSS